MPTTDTFDKLGLLAAQLELDAERYPEAAADYERRAKALRDEQIAIIARKDQIPAEKQELAEYVAFGLQGMAEDLDLPAEAYGEEEYPHAMALEPAENVSHLSGVRWPVVLAVALFLDAVAFLIGWGVWRLM